MTLALCDEFFDGTDDFAEDVTYTPSGGDGGVIRAIFLDPYAAAGVAGVRVENNKLSCYVKAADITLTDHSATVQRGSTTYSVVEIELNPDGGGDDIALLTLREVES